MNPNPPATTADVKGNREPPKARFFAKLNSWPSLCYIMFLSYATYAALIAYHGDLQTPSARLGLFLICLFAAISLNAAGTSHLEQRIGKLIDCLEKKGALTAEDRAAVVSVAPVVYRPFFTRAGLALILVLGGLLLAFISLGLLAMCTR